MFSETLKCWGLGTTKFQKLAPEPAACKVIPSRADTTPWQSSPSTALSQRQSQRRNLQPQCCLHESEAALLGLQLGTASLIPRLPWSPSPPGMFPHHHTAVCPLVLGHPNSRPHQPPSFRKISSLLIFQFILSVPMLNTGGNTDFLQTQLSVSLLFG